jgi:hypothetical protein
LNVQGAGGVMQTEMLAAELFVLDHSASDVEVAVGKLKGMNLLAVDQIPAELIQTGGETLCSEIHKIVKLVWNNEELPH